MKAKVETPMCARCEHPFHEFVCVDCDCEGLRELPFGLMVTFVPIELKYRKEKVAA